jgi:hypothetical protein
VQSQLLASRSEEYRLLFRLPPDEVIFDAFGGGGSSDPQPPLSLSLSLCDLGVDLGPYRFVLGEFQCSSGRNWTNRIEFVGASTFFLLSRFVL